MEHPLKTELTKNNWLAKLFNHYTKPADTLRIEYTDNGLQI